MSQENLEVLYPIYAAWERGDFSSAEWAHPDIEFVAADGFEPGSYVGLAEMAQAWQTWLSAWEEYRVEVDEYRPLDDERTLVLMVHCGRGRTSGLDVGQVKRAGANVLHVRDGKVSRLVLYWDRERAFADLGLSGQAMSQGNVEVVRRTLDAWAEGNFGAGADHLDRHVVFVVSDDFPEAGVFVGPVGVVNYMRTFLENWERYTVEAYRIDAVGDTVLARCTQRGQARDGLALEAPTFALFTFRAGRIIRLEWLRHESEALEAAGLSEQGASADS